MRWRNLSGRRAPETLPRPLLFRLVAFRQQAAAIGDLDPASVLLLKRLAKEHPGAEERPARRATRALPPPGSILLREWKGETHRVAVTRDGFAWNGEVHASLSGVARAITGVNWNGFVFFGLTKKAKPSRGKDIAP